MTSPAQATQNSEDAETRKQKRLAALFSMSDDSSEEAEEPILPPPAPTGKLITRGLTERATRSQARQELASSSSVMDTPTIESTSTSTGEVSPSTSTLRRSPRKPQSTAVLNSQTVEIPATQDSDEEGIVPSGICPASPEFSEEPTLPTPFSSRPSTSGGATRQKRRQEEEITKEEEGLTEETVNKKRRVLQEVNGDADAAPVPALPAIVRSQSRMFLFLTLARLPF